MRIVLDLPDWVDERHIYIMAGIELVAHRLPGMPWYVKTVRCNMCGKCCMELGDKQPFPITTTDGICDHLQKEPGDNEMWRCALSLQRPFGCSIGETDKDYCCIEWVEVN